ncbi:MULTISPECIES: tyrosine-type recombinase/integrase [Pseudofrankia]|uniref:tyrosine-type recombinase/integrase n=1 Tax=Pseudofrankia TaxID=2994363 RepID=UPI000234C70E|nr:MULTISPECIES: site-specific integrase [Pseudofrankia]OHV33533.1 integrase [Pseudofrankia sp. EUN1h]
MAARKGRRGAGEGAIYKSPDGRWRASVDLGWRDGKRQRKYLSGRTRAEVAEKLRKLRRQQEDGVVVAVTTGKKPPTVGQWVTFWVEHIAPARVRPSTLDGYRSKVNHRIIPALGGYKLEALQPENVETWRDELLAEGLAPATVRQCFRILSRALKVAVQRGKVARNVCALVDAPAVQRDEIRPLTAQQARQILKVAADDVNPARWSVALSLGLRQGEALGLAWDAVDLVRGTIAVRQALQRRPWQHGCGDTPCGKKRAGSCPSRVGGGGLVLVAPKSRAGRRTITLPRPLVRALRDQRDRQRKAAEHARDLWKNEWNLVFTQPNGCPLDPARDWATWKRLLEQAGVPHARLHDARHTAATLLLAQGTPARVAMEILGHSQISLTLDTYSHVIPEMQRDAADGIGSVLWDPEDDGQTSD